jgi:hypothetical protein
MLVIQICADRLELSTSTARSSDAVELVANRIDFYLRLKFQSLAID